MVSSARARLRLRAASAGAHATDADTGAQVGTAAASAISGAYFRRCRPAGSTRTRAAAECARTLGAEPAAGTFARGRSAGATPRHLSPRRRKRSLAGPLPTFHAETGRLTAPDGA